MCSYMWYMSAVFIDTVVEGDETFDPTLFETE